MYKPKSKAALAKATSSEKQWITPELVWHSFKIRKVSSAASRVWTITGRPLSLAAWMWSASVDAAMTNHLTPVIVQTGFADADDFRMFGRFYHFGDGKFLRFLAVGMYADGAVDVVVRLGNVEDFGKTLFADADGKRLFDALRFHIWQRLRAGGLLSHQKLRWQCESIKYMVLQGKSSAVAA